MQINESNQKWIAIGVAIGVTSIVVVGLITFSVNVLQEYGAVLFTLVPLALGILSTSVYGLFRQRSLKESAQVSFYTLALACGILILFNTEGIVCILMASPFVAVFVFIGTLIGYKIQKRNRDQVVKMFSLNLLVIPLLMTAESEFFERESGEIEVKTSIVINASKEVVWDNVVKFPDIPAPTEWIFRTGIAYPTSSKIIGTGEDAIRYCEFTTGSFVEPIEIWDEPNHLQFSVREQPIPLKRMIYEKSEVPGNMYKYFVSNKGQFRLTKIGENQVLLEGTTWYYHKIRPVSYWKIWSEYIIHSIHKRVLKHIKTTSEAV